MSKTRQFVLENYKIFSINSNIAKVFEEAQVDTLIILFDKVKFKDSNQIAIWDFDPNYVYRFKHSLEQKRFFENEGNVFDVEVNDTLKTIIDKVRSKSQYLEDYLEITRGVNPYDKYRGQSEEVIQNKLYHAKTPLNETFVPELRGKHVSFLSYKWDGVHYISYGAWLAAPRSPKFFEGKRILFREIIGSRFVCAFVEEKFIIDRSLYIGLPKNEQIDLLGILGLLYSKLLVWVFKFEKNEFDDLFPKIRLEEFKKLPVYNEFSNHPELSNLVSKIIQLKQSDPAADTTALEREIDVLVYGLYGLSAEEVAIVEGK